MVTTATEREAAGLPAEGAYPDPATLGPVRLSQDAFVRWSRFDPEGLRRHAAARGGLVVRVAVPRQRWPARTMAD